MIKFKEHDGLLFKMLDKPVPLTKDAEMPCIIAPIQDDSPMGRYVKQCWGHDKLFMREYTICNINADMAAKVGVAKSTPLSIHMFEIIGTLVEEGSADWALYQMMQGEKICHHKSPSIVYCKHAGDIRRQVRYNCVDYMSASAWLNGADKNGWQIYEEPKPEPEPPREPEYVICKRCGGTGYEIKPEPAKEQFEVGDWVRGKSGHDYEITAYPSKFLPDNPNVYDAIPASFMYGQSLCLELSDIESKLKPSEVIVHIGCLSGRVEPVSTNGTHIWFHLVGVDDKTIATIRISCLDTPTREIVESLLKAQEEE